MYGFPFVCVASPLNPLAHLARYSPLAKSALLVTTCLLPLSGKAQDEFLRCADLAQRDARVQCLEAALEAAVSARNAREGERPATAETTRQATAGAAQSAAPASAAVAEAAPTNDSSRFDLFGLFDREQEQRAQKEQQQADTMRARVADLQFYKPDVLTITLDNGQVWRQLYARRYNLREGDVISIHQSGWGNQFRLEAERFSGFIQVQRLR